MRVLLCIWNWFLENRDWAPSLIVDVLISLLLYFLSKKLSEKTKLEHKERIKDKADALKLGREIYLVNTKRYFKDYPSNKEKTVSGYSHIKAEIKGTRFDGVEFICGIKEVYRKENGNLVFINGQEKTPLEKFKVFEVGMVPYEWIQYVDLRGDEHGFIPLFFCRFKGRRYWKKTFKKFLPFGYPYKKIVYYRDSEVYHPESDPVDMKFTFINESIGLY